MTFVEGDALHPAENIARMSAGIALTDDDRWPWLDRVAARLAQAGSNGVVVSCSALKKTYRDRLRAGAGQPLRFVFLTGSRAVLESRMGHRTGHFMPTSLLVTVDIDRPLDAVIALSLEGLLHQHP